MDSSGRLVAKRRSRLEDRIRQLVADRLRTDFWSSDRKALLAARMDDVIRLQSDPYALAEELIKDFKTS
jgi:putative protein kinase ArgK-like GTPase of G3E family